MVWCHGGPGLWDYLEPVAGLLTDDFTVYRYDQRACGRSTGAGPHTVARNVADLEALRLHWGIESWTVAGHSWGATLALAYALAHPHRVQALIYCSGTGIAPGWKQPYRAERTRRLGEAGAAQLRAARELWERESSLEAEKAYCEIAWSTDFAEGVNSRSLAKRMFVEGARINPEVNKLLGDDSFRYAESLSRQQLQALKVPALVLHGEADPRPAWAGERLAECLPDGRFMVLSGVGHLPWLEDAEAFQEAVLGFLDSALKRDGHRAD